MSISSADNPPLVHSVSYGWQGNMTTLTGCLMSNVNDVDAEFTKLAAKGITIVFASGDSGAGYTPPHANCGSSVTPPPGSQKGKALTGTVARNMSASSMSYCCDIASEEHAKGWTFTAPKADTCKTQTLIKGVAWDGYGEPLPEKISSQDECCTQATMHRSSMWSYNAQAQKCTVFDEVKGRHEDPGSVS